MTFTIPNAVAATYPEQAQVDKLDFDVLTAGSNLTGTVSGCGVTAVSGLTVRLAAGTVRIAGRPVTVAQQDFILTADATQKKFYLISVNTSGTGTAEAGSAAAAPTFPDVTGAYAVPPTKSIQAAIEVPGGAVSLAAGNIVDKRVFVPPAGVLTSLAFGVTAYGSEALAAAGIDSMPALNAAIVQAAASWASGGGPGVIDLPPGYIGMGSQMVLYRGVVAGGTGTDRDRGGSCFVAQSGLTTDGIVCDPAVTSVGEWMHSCGLQNFQMRMSRQTAGIGIRLYKLGENAVVDRVQVNDPFGPGLFFESTATPFRVGHLTVFGCGRGYVSTGSHSASSSTTLTTSGLTASALVGQVITVMTGTGAGAMGVCTANTTTQITVASWTGATTPTGAGTWQAVDVQFGRASGVVIDTLGWGAAATSGGTGNTAFNIDYISCDNCYGSMLWTRNIGHANVVLHGWKAEARIRGTMPYVIVNEDGKTGRVQSDNGFVYTSHSGSDTFGTGIAILYGKRTATVPGNFESRNFGGYDATDGSSPPTYQYGRLHDDANMPSISVANLRRQPLIENTVRIVGPTGVPLSPEVLVQGALGFISGDTTQIIISYGAGAPSHAAPNGSQHNRTDGSGTTDNFYIRRGGAWVGIA